MGQIDSPLKQIVRALKRPAFLQRIRHPISNELGTISRLPRLSQATAKDDVMLKWALIFFVISIIAGFFGFSGVSAATATIARVLFGIALVIFLIFLVLALMAGQAIL
ncbi:small integral membrane protein [Rhizobium leguminosarum bv. viciae WSM1455]|nr:small integral membrane protein [Rhizobium leguminosarum bv. viciae WSM1455]